MNRLYILGLVELRKIHKTYKSGHSVVTAELKHVDFLASNMREEDVAEVEAMGHTPKEALLTALERDDFTFTVLDPHKIPYAMFGAGQAEPPYIWMLGTNDVRLYQFEFLKRCREWVWGFVGIYEKVHNYVSLDNKTAIKWLEWCGAVFVGDVINVNGKDFQRFEIEVKNV